MRMSRKDDPRAACVESAKQLPQPVRLPDPFHVTKLELTALDQVRRSVQQTTAAGIGVIVASRHTGFAPSRGSGR